MPVSTKDAITFFHKYGLNNSFDVRSIKIKKFILEMTQADFDNLGSRPFEAVINLITSEI
jgi:hypothetical protein